MRPILASVLGLLLAGCVGGKLEVEPRGSESRAVFIASWPGELGATQEAWFIFPCSYKDTGSVCRPLGPKLAAPGPWMVKLIPDAQSEELDDGQRVQAYYREQDATSSPPPQVYAKVCPLSQRAADCYWLAPDYRRDVDFAQVVYDYMRRFVGDLLYGESSTVAYLQHLKLGQVLLRLAP